MARFVSRYGAYTHGVQEEVSEIFSRGTRVVQKGIEAKFSPNGMTDEEIAYALEVLSFHGLPEDRDTGSNVSGRSRLSLFDSQQYAKANRLTDEEHDLVVQTLRESERNGLDYVEITPQAAKLPWNGYDNLNDASQIVDLAIATETSIDGVLAYERENRNRTEVIEALEELLEVVEPEGAVVIDASA